MLNINDILDNRYEIISKIGQGGMSYVYRAVDKKLGREVAIKVLKEEYSADEDFVSRFKNEARAAARLSHPNIVAAYDIVDSGDVHYIVMELVEGITLKNYIAKKSVLTNKETIGIAIQAASGIAEAHRNGIIHRDVKPQNIIISKDGKIKVADFGIAMAVTGDKLNNNAVIGSAHYMAPEQARTGETDARSDIYSLGISMYEMITGTLPFDGESTVDIVMEHIQNAMVPPSVYNHDIYPALNDIILKATKKDPSERYQSCEELVEDLRHAVSEPEGHFVKMFSSVGSSEIAASGEDKTGEAAGDSVSLTSETVKSDTEAADNAGKADSASAEQAVKEGQKESGAGKKNKFTFIALICFLALAVAIFALIMLKKAGDRREEFIKSEPAGEDNGGGSESEEESEMDYTISISGEELMPDLSGMDVDAARAMLSTDYQLSMDSSAEAFSEQYERGQIVSQSPEKGSILSADVTVYVTVSKGSVLNDIKGNTVEEATNKLIGAGYTVDNTADYDFSDVAGEGLVMGHEFLDENGEPIDTGGDGQGTGTAAGTGESEGASGSEPETPESAKNAAAEAAESKNIRLIVSRGSQNDYVVMPDIIDFTRADAEHELLTRELSIGTVTALNTEEYSVGRIAGQSVAADDYVKKGSVIDVQVSVGNSDSIADGTDITDTPLRDIIGGDSVGSTELLSDDYYYGSIDTSCVVGERNGPGAAEQIYVGVRLRQNVDGADEYTMISNPIPVAAGTRIPVTYKYIRGAYGEETGYVEVFNNDTGVIYSAYKISFGPV